MMIDPDGNKVTMLCDDFIFHNSKSVFVEYIDVIKAPYYQLLKILSVKENKDSRENFVFDFSKVEGMSDDDISDFYYKRRHQNVLIDFVKPIIQMPDYGRIDMVMDNLIAVNKCLTDSSPNLRFIDVIKKLMWKDAFLAKKVFIYYPYNNKVIRDDVQNTFNFSSNIEFIWGEDLGNVIQESVPADSTYVFSNIRNIDILNDIGRLKFSSVLVPYEYGYNHTESSPESDWVIDINAYQKDVNFKFSAFLASVYRA